MISGDGEGMVDAADVGLLDGAGVVAVQRVVPDAGRVARARSAPDAALVVTDENREPGAHLELGARQRRLHRAGGGEAARRRPERRAASRCSPARRPTRSPRPQQRGVKTIQATAYGNTITYTPEDRAARALDGDIDDRVARRRARQRGRAVHPPPARGADPHRPRQ